jgi:hypothetical protein
MSQRFLNAPQLDDKDFFLDAKLPYGLQVKQIGVAMANFYSILNLLNTTLISKGHDRLEEFLLTNAFAGFISEALVKSLSEASGTLVRNRKTGGHPDLIPRGKYKDDLVLMGEGIEVKASLQKGGWQGHNPEKGWLMVFQYSIDIETEPKENRNPTEFVQVLAAELIDRDWSFSGRTGKSRRTITASINRQGMRKLRMNPIYMKGAASQRRLA